MTAKILASATAVVGALGVIYSLLAAFGIEVTQNQQTAITGVAGLVLVIAGIWLHPSVPVGVSEP